MRDHLCFRLCGVDGSGFLIVSSCRVEIKVWDYRDLSAGFVEVELLRDPNYVAPSSSAVDPMDAFAAGHSIDSDTSQGQLLTDLLKVQPIVEEEEEAPPTNEMYGRMVVRATFDKPCLGRKVT